MNKETIALMRKIIHDRIENSFDSFAWATFDSIFEYALQNNIECLREFDYYGD